MDEEAARLRERAHELRSKLQELRGEASSLSAPRRSAAASAASGDGVSAIEGLNDEAHELAAQMYGVANQRSDLRVRLGGLETEKQYQQADHQLLEEKLLESRHRRRALSKRLVALCADLEDDLRVREDDVDSFASEDAQSGDDEDQHLIQQISASGASGGGSLAAAAREEQTTSASCSGSGPSSSDRPGTEYPMHDAWSPEHTRDDPQASQADDLEFAYDWGLELAGRMSVERAMQLANWAATRCRQADEAKSSGELRVEMASPMRTLSGHDADETRFEEPLQELQAALSILQTERAVSGSAGDEPRDASEFDAPLSELTEALATLSRQASGGAAAAKAEDPDHGDGGSAFAKPIADLQDIIMRLSAASQEQAPTSAPSHEPAVPEDVVGADLAPATPIGNAASSFGKEVPQVGSPVLSPLSTLMPLSPIQTLMRRKYQGLGIVSPPSPEVR